MTKLQTKIKCCGIRSPETVPVLNELLPDYVGFILSAPYWRCISPEEAATLREALDPGIKVAGVFVDEPPDFPASLLNKGVIDLAQLHGAEDNAYIEALRSHLKEPCKIIKAFRIRGSADLSEAENSAADYVLLDAGTGEGKPFDWTLIRDFKRPYFLAGGLTPETVGNAIRLLHPYAVDVSSGVETDRKKDPEKLRAFVKNARGTCEPSAFILKGDPL